MIELAGTRFWAVPHRIGPLIGLMATSIAAGAATTQSPSASTRPPILGTFALTDTAQIPDAHCSAANCTLIFTPSGSKAVLGPTGTFVVDVAGDYVFGTNAGEPVGRVLGVEWGSDPAGPGAIRLRDPLHGHGRVMDSTTEYSVWQPPPPGVAETDAGLAFTGLNTTITATEPQSFFAEPLNMTCTIVSLNSVVEFRYQFETDVPTGTNTAVAFQVSNSGFAVGVRASGAETRWVVPETNTGCSGPMIASMWINASHVKASVSCNNGGNTTGPVDHRLAFTDFVGVSGKVDAGANVIIGLAAESSASAPAQALVSQFILASTLAAQYSRQVFYPVPGFFPPDGPPLGMLGGAHDRNFRAGFLDVTLPPFRADPTGARDSTAAIQWAINYAYRNFLISYFPVGTYTVTDTIVCEQTNFLSGMRSAAYYLRGQLSVPGRRATFRLPPHTPVFSATEGPLKPLIYFWHRNPENQSQPNMNMNQVLHGINIDLTSGNFGAVGVYNRAAQGSSIQDVTVYAGNSAAGIAGGAGSGGSHIGVTVIGGRYGANYAEAQPAATMAGFTLLNQSCAGILYCGGMAVTIVGTTIATSIGLPGYTGILAGACSANKSTAWLPGFPASTCVPRFVGDGHVGYDAVTSGHVSVVDTSIEMRNSEAFVAILTDSSIVYLRGVYTKGFKNITKFERSGVSLAAPDSASWNLVGEYTHGDLPPLHYLQGKAYQLHFPTYVDGKRWQDGDSYAPTPIIGALPPNNLQDRHMWGPAESFPSFESSGAINVRDVGVLGDGIADDTDALQAALNTPGAEVVFLPRGIYRVSRTLLIPSGVALVGVAHHLVVIAPVDAGFASARVANITQPLLRTARDNETSVTRRSGPLNTVVAWVSTVTWESTPEVFAIDWQNVAPSSSTNIYRQGSTWIKNGPCSFGLPPASANCGWGRKRHLNVPMFRVAGDGRFYVVHAEDGGYWKNNSCPDYRHFLVTGRSTGRRAVYNGNWEHAIADANAEVRDADNVEIYALKSEGRNTVLWLRNSSNVLLTSYGGNACPYAAGTPGAGGAGFPPSLFRVSDGSFNFTLASLVAFDMATTLPTTNLGSDVTCVPPDQWISVFEMCETGNLSTKLLDRPAIYLRS